MNKPLAVDVKGEVSTGDKGYGRLCRMGLFGAVWVAVGMVVYLGEGCSCTP